ncbi:hypothetical protein Cpir12675_000158 [Ceratocystis pirilliformis]|uniref:ATP-dependent RNA helicase DHX29 n=1 Tax=Ceratocystis pirilliformis TaxID=259994 RepID=A0ABR3ZPG3_9PEZI
MAPKRKKVTNPSRGFATTSVASKPRVDATPDATTPNPENATKPANDSSSATTDAPKGSLSTKGKHKTPASGVPGAGAYAGVGVTLGSTGGGANPATCDAPQNGSVLQKELTAEEFAAQLEESELQLLVETSAEKVRLAVKRQQQRLQTDRRVLRGQADPISSQKWMPQEIVDRIMSLIQAEKRFGSGQGTASSSQSSAKSKNQQEDNVAIRLWTLERTLTELGFSNHRIQQVIQAVLEASPDPNAIAKDSIWGLEEALEWFARECSVDELPSYEDRGREKKPHESVPPSGQATPRQSSPHTKKAPEPKKPRAAASKKKPAVMYDISDIEPEDLAPQYLETKTKIFQMEHSLSGQKKDLNSQTPASDVDTITLDKLKAKLARIQNDVLFDKFAKIEADRQWHAKKVMMEKEIAAAKQAQAKATTEVMRSTAQKNRKEKEAENPVGVVEAGIEKPTEPENDSDKLAREAERMAAEIIAEAEDENNMELGDLFSSLPQMETGEDGKSTLVSKDSNGKTVTIHDFGEPTGTNPISILTTLCRSRNSQEVKTVLISESPFAVRHLVAITWSKPQDLTTEIVIPEVSVYHSSELTEFSMTTIAAPNKAQSQAFIAVAAMYYLTLNQPKEQKSRYLQLSPQWKEVWDEWELQRKQKIDAIDRECLRNLRDLVKQKQTRDLEDGVILQKAFRGRVAARKQGDGESANTDRSAIPVADSDAICKIWADKTSTPKFRAMTKFRSQLPMWRFKSQVLEAIDNHPIIIICGETGCGKSTQVPAFILEHKMSQGKRCKVYCTEPRRISAVALARRVSEELGENRGDIGTYRSLVGYSIRLESNTTKETKLVYATTGIVMRMLENSNDLQEITHLVLDEVHERTIDSDFLLIVLKRLMKRRPDLKVVLMSATIQADVFSKYLDGAPVLQVPGRTFPVETKFIEDAIELTGWTAGEEEQLVQIDDDAPEPDADGTAAPKADLAAYLAGYSSATKSTVANLDEKRIEFDLILQLIAKIGSHESYIPYSKAVLVFLPGMADIRTLSDMLLGDPTFKDWLIYPLHSSIATEDQEMAFVVPPEGKRKIVLATNIAETGITIPDITCVIDTGKHKEMRFIEKRQMSQLLDTYISRANAKQRRGRAGRVQQGLCFHMFTRFRFENRLADDQQPEMLRLSLQDLAMRIKICKLGGIEETLNEAMSPPLAKNIKKAIDSLVDVRALTSSEELTPLGVQLARLPVDVFLGKLLLLGTVFRCLDMSLTVAAVLSAKSPFQAPFGQRAQADNARMAFRRGDSDLLTVYNAYCAWRKTCLTTGKDFQFCRKNYLNQQALSNIEDLKGQLMLSLIDAGVLALTDEERRNLDRVRFMSNRGRRGVQAFYELPQRVNRNSDIDAITTSVIAWSFYPKLLVRETPASRHLRNVGNNQTISLHPTSINKASLTDAKWLSYYHILESKKVYHAHETTAADPFAIALLCGDVRCDLFNGIFTLDGNRARFSLQDWKSTLAIKALRLRLREILSRSFKNPGALPTPQQQKWLDIWQRIFEQDFEEPKTSGISSGSSTAGGNSSSGISGRR